MACVLCKQQAIPSLSCDIVMLSSCRPSFCQLSVVVLCPMTTNENIGCSLFGCHVTISDVASSLMVS